MDRINRFIYLHIMKTAGTSVSHNLKRIYKKKYLLDHSYQRARTKRDGIFRFSEDTENTYPKQYKKYSVVHGHFTFEKYKHLGWPVITFLRNPVQRVISRYFSVKKYADYSLDLQDFCIKSANEMTQMTGGDLSKFAFVGIVEKFSESLKRLGLLLGHQLNNVVRNKTTNKRKLTSKDMAMVKRYNKKDLDLYAKALKIWGKV